MVEHLPSSLSGDPPTPSTVVTGHFILQLPDSLDGHQACFVLVVGFFLPIGCAGGICVFDESAVRCLPFGAVVIFLSVRGNLVSVVDFVALRW